MAIDPKNSDVIYAEGFKSVDGGGSWEPFESGYLLTVDPDDSHILYKKEITSSSIAAGFYVSADGGISWNKRETPFEDWVSINSITPFSNNSDSVILGTDQGLWIGDDYGVSWRLIGLDSVRVEDVEVDAEDTDVIYATGKRRDYGFWITRDGGDEWFFRFDSIWVECIEAHPTRPGEVYIGTFGSGVFRSKDRGVHWEPQRRGLWRSLGWPIQPLDEDTIDSASGLPRVTLGEGYERVQMNINGSEDKYRQRMSYVVVSDIAISKIVPDLIYAGTNMGFFRSVGDSIIWEPKLEGLERGDMIDIAVSESQPGWAYAIGDPGLYRTRNYGLSWEYMGLGSDSFAAAVAVDPHDGDYIYASIVNILFGNDVWMSDNGGNDWIFTGIRGMDDFLGATAIVVDPHNPSTVYASVFQGGVWKTTDRGEIWTALQVPVAGIFEITIAPDRPDHIYLTVLAGVLESEDGGINWNTMPLPVSTGSLPFLAVGSDERIYLGLFGQGLYRSYDGGNTWQSIFSGMIEFDIGCIAVYPTDPDHLYLGVDDEVFRSNDAGESWENISEGLPGSFYLNSFGIDTTDGGVIYLATSAGIYKLMLNENLPGWDIIPRDFAMLQNYPNPFNPVTRIDYRLPYKGLVRIVVYDILGHEVTRLVDGHKNAGYHSVTWDASNAATGLYFYRLSSGGYVETKKMLLIK